MKFKLSKKSHLGSRFFSVVELDEHTFEDVDLEDSEPIVAEIEMLRTGSFKHRIYGDLDITTEMLESMKKNFENNVLGREVSFDWNHRAEAASSWLKGLDIQDDVLIGTVEFTAKGAESIASKEYGYFSIEYSDDYKDSETEKTFGPTILGGALTNRPFISKLKKIEFSLDGEEASIFRLEEKPKEVKMSKDVKKTPVVGEEDNDKDITLEEAIAKIKELEDSNKKLSTKASDADKLQDNVNIILESNKKMEKRLEELEKTNKGLEEKVVLSEKKATEKEIEIIRTKLLSDEKHHPAVVAVAVELMKSDSGEKVFKFEDTVKDGENDKKVEVVLSLSDAILRILEAIPKSQRADYTEKTTISDSKSFTEEEQAKIEDQAIKKAFAKKRIIRAVK
jgi:hypothetical protein